MKLNEKQKERFMNLVSCAPLITKEIDYSIQKMGLVEIIDNEETNLSEKGFKLLRAADIHNALKYYDSEYQF